MTFGRVAARYLTQSMGHGAGIGAGIGAAAGAVRTPQEGQSRIGNVIHGGIAGGVAGGLVGGAGRAYRDTRLLAKAPMNATQTVRGTAQRLGTDAANMGRRQWYGLTGRGDPNAIGMAGKHTSEEQVKLLNLRRNEAIGHAAAPRHAAIHQDFDAQIAAERKLGLEAQRNQDAGITNIPGIGKALATKGRRGEALRAMGRTMGSSPGQLAWSVGLPAVASVPSLMKGDESATGGLTTGQKVRNFGISMASGAAFGGLPMGAQIAAGLGTEALLRARPRRLMQRPLMDRTVGYGAAPQPYGQPLPQVPQ